MIDTDINLQVKFYSGIKGIHPVSYQCKRKIRSNFFYKAGIMFLMPFKKKGKSPLLLPFFIF